MFLTEINQATFENNKKNELIELRQELKEIWNKKLGDLKERVHLTVDLKEKRNRFYLV